MANTGNTQQIINYGATANDGTGDPLRTAFIKTDENFDNVWLAGPVGSNVTISNNTIQTNNTNGNITIKPNGTGIIQANASIIPNSTGTRDLGSSALSWRRAYIDELLPETLTVSGDATIGGNLTVQGDTIQIGNITTDTLTIQLANTASNKTAANGAGITVGANDVIATFLFNSTSNTWVTNIGANVSGNITANYFIGNGSLLTGISTTGNSLVNGNSNVIVVNNGNVSVSANGTANILTVTDANLGWNSTQLAQVIVEGSLRATSGVRATSVDARSNIYSGVSDGTIRGGTLIISDVGNGNGAISAVTGSFSGNLNAGNIFVANNISATENINGKTATFTGDATGDGSMYVGFPTFTNLGSDVIAQFSGNVDSYIQFNFQNGNSGTLASGDYVITANNGDDATFFFNMGLGSNNHSDPDFFGDSSTPNDAYIYVVGNNATGPGDTGPGNLIIGSTNGSIKMFVGNTAQANVVQTLTRSGVTVTGNIIPSANATYSLGNSTRYWSNLWVANNTIYLGGVPLGMTSGNVLTVNGNAVLSNNSNTAITTTGNITANYFSGNGSLLTGIPANTGNFVFANNQMSVANTAMEISATGSGADVDIEAADAVFIEALVGEVDIRSADETFISTGSGGNIWTFGIDGNLTLPTGKSIIVDGGDGAIGPVSDDMVISWDNEELILRSVAGSVQVEGDNDFNIRVDYNSGAGDYLSKWAFAQDNEIVNITGNSAIVTEAGNLNLQGGRNTINSGNVTITAINTGVAVNVWTFDNTGNLTAPGNIITTGNVTGNTAGFAIGYRDIPQVSFTGNATLAATDAGKHYYSTLATANTLTIANNTSVSWTVGTAITVVNRGSGNITVAQGTGVSLYLAGNSTAANRTVATYGMATLLNVAANVWMINGTGVS
jgi:hypothetical protein